MNVQNLVDMANAAVEIRNRGQSQVAELQMLMHRTNTEYGTEDLIEMDELHAKLKAVVAELDVIFNHHGTA